jgi:type IX secretion system PorP/SprF family membrane protein
MYFYNSSYFAGISLPTILSYRETPGGNGYDVYNKAGNYQFLINGGGLINISDNFKLKPSTLIRYSVSTPVLFDLNISAFLLKDGILSVGASYREKDALVGLIEVQLNPQLRIGYSYDYSFSALGNSGGSHEITLRYEFKYIVNALNPRFF